MHITGLENYIVLTKIIKKRKVLTTGYRKFPNSIKASDILYKLSLSLIELNNYEEACETLDKLNYEFPFSKY